MTQGDYLKILFKERNLKIKDIATKMNIATNTLSSKIAGKRNFKPKEITVLLEILNLTYEEVFKIKNVSIVDNDKTIIVIDGKKYEIPSKFVVDIVKVIWKIQEEKEAM